MFILAPNTQVTHKSRRKFEYLGSKAHDTFSPRRSYVRLSADQNVFWEILVEQAETLHESTSTTL